MTSQNENVKGEYVPVVRTTNKSVFSVSPRLPGEFTKGDTGKVVTYGLGHTLRVVAISGTGNSRITVSTVEDLKILRDVLDEYIQINS